MTNSILDIQRGFREDPDGGFNGFSSTELAFDELTGFYQRKVWMMEGAHLLAHATRQNEEVALMFVDLNNLKTVNDNKVWGSHALGDTYVKLVSELLKRSLRMEDIVGRLGGDEFGILLTNLSKDDAMKLLSRIKSAMDQLIDNNPSFKNIPPKILGLSIGISFWDGRENIDSLVDRADKEMYREKRQSKIIKTGTSRMYVAE